MISKPTLPPRRGYVEVEIDGVRQYKKIDTLEDVAKEKSEQEISTLKQHLEATEDALNFLLMGGVE